MVTGDCSVIRTPCHSNPEARLRAEKAPETTAPQLLEGTPAVFDPPAVKLA
jgi:hypothetical protein